MSTSSSGLAEDRLRLAAFLNGLHAPRVREICNFLGSFLRVHKIVQSHCFPPNDGETLRPVGYGASIVNVESENYYDAQQVWVGSTGESARQILGHIDGQPDWLQGEEVPSCDQCGEPMSFVAQLEEGPDYKTAMNFGGGCAYVYRCRCDRRQAKMLWQC